MFVLNNDADETAVFNENLVIERPSSKGRKRKAKTVTSKANNK